MAFLNPSTIGLGLAAAGTAQAAMQKGKARPIDISQSLAKLQQGTDEMRRLNKEMSQASQRPLQDYRTSLADELRGSRERFATNKADYLGATGANAALSEQNLRGNLWQGAFKPLPGILQQVRETSAAGGGLGTGSYQKAVGDVGTQLAQTIGEGERDIQLAGLEKKQAAEDRAFSEIRNLESRLTDQQMSGLINALNTENANIVRDYTTAMGITENDVQGVIDLLNFKESQKLAQAAASDANRYSIANALVQGGASIYGRGA